MLYKIFESFIYSGTPYSQVFITRLVIIFTLSLIISIIFGGMLIKFLQKKQIGESIRDLGLQGQLSKKGTPTMGGLIIIFATIIPVLLICNLNNICVLLLILTTLWCGAIGFTDDYIKVFKKKKEGMRGPVKIILQVALGAIVALCLFTNKSYVIYNTTKLDDDEKCGIVIEDTSMELESQSTATNFPFFTNNEFNYNYLVPFKGQAKQIGGWVIYAIVILMVMFFGSNGTNLTDGLDGLSAGSAAIVAIVVSIIAFLSSNIPTASTINSMFIPHSSEICLFMTALFGALIGFLWYNTYPAQVFMGDTGSLALGGIIGVSMLLLRKELFLPLLCGVFTVEGLSVIFQRYYFKFTKSKYGEGRRVFKMTPLHHHFQKEGIDALITRPKYAMPETKIVGRFWIAGIILGIATLAVLFIY